MQLLLLHIRRSDLRKLLMSTGELSSLKKAALPLAGAIGGMVVPALFYVGFNWGREGLHGWGIPMATDIAFALAALNLMGRSVPTAAKVFLTALAIVDDIGAVLVIAFFYTSDVSFIFLMAGMGFFCGMLVLNALKVRPQWIYLCFGTALWFCFLKSGVHATVAGVLAAFAIPARVVLDTETFRERARKLLDRLKTEDAKPADSSSRYEGRTAVLVSLENQIEKIQPPSHRVENLLHPWVSYFIMPIFAFANAGVVLSSESAARLMNPISLGVLAGLVLGKPLGIFGMSWLSIRLGWAQKPRTLNWVGLLGLAWLGGIGFTMSLFVGNLAFADPVAVDTAKGAVFLASLLAAIMGLWMIQKANRMASEEALTDSVDSTGVGRVKQSPV